ncbi:MAG: AAA family ATPase [Phycisphaerales bacterium]|jgi:hypothetical protein
MSDKLQNKYEGFFTELKHTRPFAKVAAQGQAGSGKTYTLAKITAGLYQYINSEKPIVIFDTERSAKFLRPYFESLKIKVLLKESRSLKDLTDTIDFCDNGGSEILIIDSITHVYENFLEAFKKKKGRTFIQFQDWGILKPTWKREYSDRLVLAKCHILFTGREGYTYEYEDINGKKELVKTGVKMKVESETAYEPDLLLYMTRHEDILAQDGDKSVWREAMVVKDRSALIDGKVFKDPDFEHFKPVIDFLIQTPSEDATVSEQDDGQLIDDEDNRRESKTKKDILLEEITAIMTKTGLGTSAKDKAKKVEIIERIFNTGSWKKVELMNLDELTHCKHQLENDREVLELIAKQQGVELPPDENMPTGDESGIFADDDAIVEVKTLLADKKINKEIKGAVDEILGKKNPEAAEVKWAREQLLQLPDKK